MKESIKKNTRIFKALSESNRLRILRMLQIRPLCVCEITDVLLLAVSTVSKHLSILKEAGFIIEQKEGKWINYMINSNASDSRISSILASLDFWISENDLIIADKQKVNIVDRDKVCGR